MQIPVLIMPSFSQMKADVKIGSRVLKTMNDILFIFVSCHTFIWPIPQRNYKRPKLKHFNNHCMKYKWKHDFNNNHNNYHNNNNSPPGRSYKQLKGQQVTSRSLQQPKSNQPTCPLTYSTPYTPPLTPYSLQLLPSISSTPYSPSTPSFFFMVSYTNQAQP